MRGRTRLGHTLLVGAALLLVAATWAGLLAAGDEGERTAAAIESLRSRVNAQLRRAAREARSGKVQEALERVVAGAQAIDAGADDVYDEAGWARTPQAAAPGPSTAAPVPRCLPGLESGPPSRASKAIARGLAWLAAHQSPNGGWEAAGFHEWCDGKPVADPRTRPDGLGKALYDPGVTGLALYAFLRAGYTHRGEQRYADTVARGLRYLGKIQDAEGCFGPRSTQQYIYNHAIAALAMVEAYALSGSEALRRSAQQALDFIALARNPGFAWRYGIRPGDNDTSITGWMMKPLLRARELNRRQLAEGQPEPLVMDEEAAAGALAWLERMTDPETGRTGYIQRGMPPARPQELVDRFPGTKSEAMTAVALYLRLRLGHDPRRSRLMQLAAGLCAKCPPTWNPTDGSIDMYYWYYATMALSLVGGDAWDQWRQAMRSAILETQRTDGRPCTYLGSWDPIGPWGLDGGRVYATALMTLCVERYLLSR